MATLIKIQQERQIAKLTAHLMSSMDQQMVHLGLAFVTSIRATLDLTRKLVNAIQR
jgi:hypothetical protein